MKRMTLLARKESLSTSDFLSYWAGPHGKLAVDADRKPTSWGWGRFLGLFGGQFMYSYDERLRPVRLYIKLGKRAGSTIFRLAIRRRARSLVVLGLPDIYLARQRLEASMRQALVDYQ